MGPHEPERVPRVFAANRTPVRPERSVKGSDRGGRVGIDDEEEEPDDTKKKRKFKRILNGGLPWKI